MVIVDGDGVDGKELPKTGGKEAFIRGGGRSNVICVSRTAVVGAKDQWQ